MAVLRDTLFYAQQRLDVPVLRQLESGVIGDFDLLAGRIMAGQKPLIINGFNITVNGTIINNAATNLVMNVAGSQLIHYLASENGSIFFVPANRATETLNTTNSRIIGSWSANTTNYIGIDLLKSADASTSDVVQFIDPLTDLETPKIVPLARTTDYRIYIQNVPFSSTTNVAPVAIVVTDASNNVTSIEDARELMFRLGSGGDSPNSLNSFSWGNRVENPIITTTGAADPFSGGDKNIVSLKSWLDAASSRIWEVAGGEHWFSQTADRNVRLAFDVPTAPMIDNVEFDGTHIRWSGLSFIFNNSTAITNTLTNHTAYDITIPDKNALYVDVNRATDGAALAYPTQINIAPLVSLGGATVPGSRYIIAWRANGKIYVRNKEYWVGKIGAGATTTLLGNIRTLIDNVGVPGLGTTVVSTGVADPVTALVDTNNVTTKFNVIASGLTRGVSGQYGLGSGNILIGAGSMDNAILINGATPSSSSTSAISLTSSGSGNGAPQIQMVAAQSNTDFPNLLLQGGPFTVSAAAGESISVIGGSAASAVGGQPARSIYIKGGNTTGSAGLESVRIEGGNPVNTGTSSASVKIASNAAAANTSADVIIKSEVGTRLGNVLEVHNSSDITIMSVSDGSNAGTIFAIKNSSNANLATVDSTFNLALYSSGNYTYNSGQGRSYFIPANDLILLAGSGANTAGTPGASYLAQTGATIATWIAHKVPVPYGSTINSVTLYYYNNTGGTIAANKVIVTCRYFTPASLTTDASGFDASSADWANAVSTTSDTSSGVGKIVLTTGRSNSNGPFTSSFSVATSGGFYLQLELVLNFGVATNFYIYGIGLNYTHTLVTPSI